jgi:hypothetical protein
MSRVAPVLSENGSFSLLGYGPEEDRCKLGIMKLLIGRRVVRFGLFLAAALAVQVGHANATGTARIQHPDGSVSTYYNVRITIFNESMAITSSDGQGTVVFGKASCTKIDELVKCLPWDATLFQNGLKLRVPLKSGTVWLNPSRTAQPLSHSSTQLPPRGVLLAVQTRRGTYLTLTGVVDEVHR